MTRLPSLRVPAALLLFAACSNDAPIKDQASGPIDKSPGSWQEPGAEADPPVERDAGDGLDASVDAAVCTAAALTQGSDLCTFEVAEADLSRGFVLSLDGEVLAESAVDGYQLAGTTLTLVGAPCALLTGAGADAGSDDAEVPDAEANDAGDAAAGDAGATTHVLELVPDSCD